MRGHGVALQPQRDALVGDEAPAVPAVDRNVYADCEKIGTKILFMKNPPDAI